MQRLFYYSLVPSLATNELINLIEAEGHCSIVLGKEVKLSSSIEAPMYSFDGVYWAKIKGTRIYLTQEGQAAGIKVYKKPLVWSYILEKQTLFEVRYLSTEFFTRYATLCSYDGYFVSYPDSVALKENNISKKADRVFNITVDASLEKHQIGLYLKKIA